MRWIQNFDEILSRYHLIEKIPYVDMTAATCLVRCLTGQYHCIVAETEPDGICVVSINGDKAHIVGLLADGKVKQYVQALIDELKISGIKRITAVSTRDCAAYERLTGFTREYTMYYKEV